MRHINNVISKNLLNIFSNIDKIKFKNNEIKYTDVHKITTNYKYKHISLYSGEWRHLLCDCIYVKDVLDVKRLLTIAKISNCKIPKELEDMKDNEIKQCSTVFKNTKYIYSGDLKEIESMANVHKLKSLVIPSEIQGDKSYEFSKNLVDSITGIEFLEKIVICTHNDNSWNVYHSLLKY